MLFQLLRSEAELQSQNINHPIFRLPFSQYPQESPKMSQTLPLSQINQSTGAKRTIANMAKEMRLAPAWLHTLLSLHWNYDKVWRKAMGWVTPAADADFAAAIAHINHAVNIKHSASLHGQPETPIAPETAAQAVLHALAHTNEAELQQRFAAAVQHNPLPTLSDLLAALAPYCTGNKKFRQEVLQALSYAGLLPVHGHPMREQYLPDCQNQYSTHFMSNEWSYPLRFWNDGQKAA